MNSGWANFNRARAAPSDKEKVEGIWHVIRCCEDQTCPGSWWVVSRGPGYIPDGGMFPYRSQAEELAAKLNKEKVGLMKA